MMKQWYKQVRRDILKPTKLIIFQLKLKIIRDSPRSLGSIYSSHVTSLEPINTVGFTSNVKGKRRSLWFGLVWFG